MARVRLHRLGEGVVFPHEETRHGPKMDRLMLTAVCKANLSQIFGIYPDPSGEAQSRLEAAVTDQTPIEANDHLGVVHRLWPVTDVEVISAVAGVMGPKPIFIADGHHRYETAWEYRGQIYDSGALRADHPAGFVLMMCVAMEDPGLRILPTHRLFGGLPPLGSEGLTAKLGDCFTTRRAGQGAQLASTVWEDVQTSSGQGTLGLYTRSDDTWTIAELTDTGRAKLDEVASEHNEAWRELGVSILQRLVIETLLGAKDLPEPEYVHCLDEVLDGLGSGDYPLAALVMPASLEHVRAVSLGGERMPAKSTYFSPKLLSGLVINPLE
jgi:uncharacterized protein (DUF1015 family)